MIILLSPAKIMQAQPHLEWLGSSTPWYQSHASKIVAALATISPEVLAKELRLNEKQLDATLHYYAEWSRGEASVPALAYYNGLVFKHLKAQTLPEEAHQRAIAQLRVCSFLYGLLRPSDLISPYRLEGSLSLPEVTGTETLFAYWRPLLTERILTECAEDNILLMLASEEMKDLFEWQQVCQSLRVIEPLFLQRRAGKLRQITTHTKMLRGMMARQAIVEGWSCSNVDFERFAEHIGATTLHFIDEGTTQVQYILDL